MIKGLQKLKDDVNHRLHYVAITQVKKKVKDNLTSTR